MVRIGVGRWCGEGSVGWGRSREGKEREEEKEERGLEHGTCLSDWYGDEGGHR